MPPDQRELIKAYIVNVSISYTFCFLWHFGKVQGFGDAAGEMRILCLRQSNVDLCGR